MGVSILTLTWGLLGVGIISLLFIRDTHRTPTHATGSIILSLCSLLVVGTAIGILVTGQAVEWRGTWNLPFASLYVRIDTLSSIFLLLVGIIGFASAVFSYGYFRNSLTQRNPKSYWILFFLLFGGLTLLFVSYNAVLFLLAWEMMSLSSLFLVLYDHETEEVRRAGRIYALATQGGTFFLLLLFALLGYDLDFWDFSLFAYAPSVSLLFIPAFIGFGTKAGFFPFHPWLPVAHPAAPSPVSAIMSGIMIKAGVYGILRFVSWNNGPVPLSWGVGCMILGSLTGIVGVLHGLSKKDIKEILAYSSIENMGLVLLGIGVGLYGWNRSYGITTLLGVSAALTHLINHGILKSSLFLGAGIVAHAAHTRNLEELGGLAKKLHRTSRWFGLSSFGISALPPLNGFMGEFLLLLSGLFLCLEGSKFLDALLGIVIFISIGVISAGSVACFTRLWGILFLGEPRSTREVHAAEHHRTLIYPLVFLGGINLVLGVGGILLIPWIFGSATYLLPNFPFKAVSETIQILKKVLLPLGFLNLLFWVLGTILYYARARGRNRKPLRLGPTWDCGYAAPSARMQYSGTSYAQPILRTFKPLLSPSVPSSSEGGWFPKQAFLQFSVKDLGTRWFYHPLSRILHKGSTFINRIQEGRNQVYILYIAITLLLLLLLFVGDIL